MAAKSVALGAAHILIGDPTQAAGAGMVHLGSMESVTFNPGISLMGLSDAFTGDGLIADAVYALPAAATVTAELYEIQVEKIKELVLGGKEETSDTEPTSKAFGFGGAFTPVELPSLCIIPDFDYAAGVDSQYGIWLPAVAPSSLGDIVFGRVADNANSYTVEFRGARRAKDQAGEDIPVEFRVAFMGSPKALGLTWSLPDLAASL